MENYSTTQISQIQNQLSSIINLVTDAVNWGKKHLKFEDKEHFVTELKNSKRNLLRIGNSLENKSSIAVFGGSQVGKSYLIKNILSESNKPFYIVDNDVKYDFLKEINPPGVGAESTGVVTRFTIDNPSPFEDFPIKIKLLSVKDLLIIFFDSFYLDQKRIKKFPTEDELLNRLEEIEKLNNLDSSKATVITELDVLDIKQYFDEYLSKYSLLFERLESTKYWYKISNCIEQIPINNLDKVFSILWDDNFLVTNVFKKLISVLSEIDFSQFVFAPFDAVLRGKGEILDVKRLKELNTSDNTLFVKLSNGNKIELGTSLLSALTAELVFKIPEELTSNKSFIKNSDLLDFPGARSRLAIENEDISSDFIPEMILRGKVSYLFNKYSDSYQINNLLFCTNDKQLDVNEIPSLLSFWIEKNIGSTITDRSATLKTSEVPPLFIIFTFFNNQLKFDLTNDVDLTKLHYKWDTRFNRFFENEIVTASNNWHTQWTNQNNRFKNFYLLRDFKYSNDSFIGFETDGKELEINSEREAYLKSLKQSFLEHEFVINHFNNPEHSWDISSTLNSDGTSLIIENLTPVSTNNSKVRRYISVIEDEKSKINSLLNKHVFTDDLYSLRTNALRNSVNIQLSLNSIFSINPLNFNLFISKFLLKSDRLYNYFNDQLVKEVDVPIFNEYALLKTQFPLLAATNSDDENIEILRKGFYLNTKDEVITYLESKGIFIEKLFENKNKLSKTALLVIGLIELWKKENLSIANFQEFIQMGISTNVIENLIEHYLTTFERFELKEKLISKFDKKVANYSLSRGHEEYLSEISTYVLNDFIVNFGLRYLGKEELEEINLVAKQYDLDFSPILEFYEKRIEDKELKELFDQISDNNFNDLLLSNWSPLLKIYNTWFAKLKISMLANCGFVNYDEIANNDLKVIISGLSLLQKIN